MQIKIGFNNPNSGADGINVYRGTVPLNLNSLPAILETIPGNANEYADNSVIRGQTYYYVFETFKGTQKVRTGNIKATAATYTGPGPQTFLGDGDMNAGYFGLVPGSDFLSWDNYKAWTGMTFTLNPNTEQYWMKFAYKGKILYTTHQPIGAMNHSTIYQAGLLFGVEGPGTTDFFTYPATDQLRIINVLGQNYKARVFSVVPDDFPLGSYTAAQINALIAASKPAPGNANAGGPSSRDTSLDLTGSEWNDLMMRTILWRSAGGKGTNWANYDIPFLAYNSQAGATGIQGDFLAAAFISGGTLSRGYKDSASLNPGTLRGNNNVSAFYYRPVLEMIPSV